MSRILWIIEDDMFYDDEDTMVAACARNGIDYVIVKNIPFSDEILIYNLNSHEDEKRVYTEYLNNFYRPCIFYGSINLANKINRTCSIVPGTYANFKKYQCTEYYPYIGKYLLNNDYMMVPLEELYRMREKIFKNYGRHDTIFIRPNDGRKSFTGTTIYRGTLDKDLECLYKYNENKSDLVIISTPKSILKEWRIVICNGLALCGSQYKAFGKRNVNLGAPTEAYNLAKEVANLYSPDTCFTIDIGLNQNDNKYYVVEINSFSCSGLYKCDRDCIVSEVSKVCENEYNDIFSQG